MAVKLFATGDALTRKAWTEKLFRDAIRESYFAKMAGGSDSIVHVDDQLEKDQGDRITFPLRRRLVGAGVTGGSVLEGQEEALSDASYNLTLEQYRHAVRIRRGIDSQRAAYKVEDEARAAIKDWMSEKIDQICFDGIGVGVGAGSGPTKVFYRTGASTFLAGNSFAAVRTSLGTAANSSLSLALISAVKAWVKVGGNNRNYIPLRPVRVDGDHYFVLLVPPAAMYDLKASSEWQQAQRDARERGKGNPLFSGAAGVWDGVIIHEHENCETRSDGGSSSNLPWGKCVMMGAQALCQAWGRRPKMVVSDFDYENEVGYACDFIMAAGAPTFDSKTYGSVGVAVTTTGVTAL